MKLEGVIVRHEEREIYAEQSENGSTGKKQREQGEFF